MTCEASYESQTPPSVVALEASWRDFLGGQANVHSGLTFGHQCTFFSPPSSLSHLIEFHTHLPKFKGVLSFVFVSKLVIFLMISIFFVFYWFFLISSFIIWFHLIFILNLVLIRLITIYFLIIFLIEFFLSISSFNISIYFCQIRSSFFLLLFFFILDPFFLFFVQFHLLIFG